jgi:hypothetical protein
MWQVWPHTGHLYVKGVVSDQMGAKEMVPRLGPQKNQLHTECRWRLKEIIYISWEEAE